MVMRKLWRGFKVLLLVALGAGLAVGLGQCGKDDPPSNWHTLRFQTYNDKGTDYVFGMTPEAIVQAGKLEVNPPEPIKASGKAKFVSSGERANSHQLPLGYEIEIHFEPLNDMKPLPKGVTNVGCSVSTVFILKDEDGFELAQLSTGNPRYVLAGHTLADKSITTNSVSLETAKDVVSIECYMTCHSVDNGEPLEIDFEKMVEDSGGATNQP